MDKLDGLVDLVRALSKKCEDAERYESSSNMYKQYWHDEKEKTKALRKQLNEAGISPNVSEW